jgi:hypothetical protein
MCSVLNCNNNNNNNNTVYENSLSFTWNSYGSMRLPLAVFQKSFTMVFQMLLCGEYYENIYT